MTEWQGKRTPSIVRKNITASTSEIQFVDCGETIKLEIKEENETEDEIKNLEDPLSLMSEHCEDNFGVESELKIKQEIQETEDLQDPLFTEVIEQDLHIDDVTIEEFKIEDNI